MPATCSGWRPRTGVATRPWTGRTPWRRSTISRFTSASRLTAYLAQQACMISWPVPRTRASLTSTRRRGGQTTGLGSLAPCTRTFLAVPTPTRICSATMMAVPRATPTQSFSCTHHRSARRTPTISLSICIATRCSEGGLCTAAQHCCCCLLTPCQPMSVAFGFSPAHSGRVCRRDDCPGRSSGVAGLEFAMFVLPTVEQSLTAVPQLRRLVPSSA
mmetsp:Transcript_93681/g.248696  ORF Transcript_93681/g.248696 Transcript_93681/m.248696 type:complete len:216 (-) Transcript_93681:54-701(-)